MGTSIQRCWWHLPRGLSKAFDFDHQRNPQVKQAVEDLGQLLRDAYALGLNQEEALEASDTFRGQFTTEHTANYLQIARPHGFARLDRAAREGRCDRGAELGTGVLELQMREINARTDIGGSRWSIARLRDLIHLLLAGTANHPAATAFDGKPSTQHDPVRWRGSTLADATEGAGSGWANKLDAPPFQAFAVACGSTFTFGGPHIATDSVVLDTEGEIIQGLLGCGELVGSLRQWRSASPCRDSVSRLFRDMLGYARRFPQHG